MIERNELIFLQAKEADRLQAERDAEADLIANEIIDEILAEEPGGDLRRARQAEDYERELMAAAARIKKWQTVKTDSLPAIRRALAEKQVAAPIALALAYQLGLEVGWGLTPETFADRIINKLLAEDTGGDLPRAWLDWLNSGRD